MHLKLFIAGALLVGSAALQAQPIEEYPSVVLSASFTRDFHVEDLVAGASIAGRLNDSTTRTAPSFRPIPMLAAGWRAGEPTDRFAITFMGVPVDAKHRLDAAGEEGSNWGWWVLGGIGVAAIAVVAVSTGGGGDNHSQAAGATNCTNSTGVGPASVQNCQ